MKVIELLNKIANGEKVPKKIRVGNGAFELSLVELNGSKHYSGNTESVLNNALGMGQLNDEVEIIEEDKKIKKLPPSFYENVCLTQQDRDIAKKINEIIDKINSMEE